MDELTDRLARLAPSAAVDAALDDVRRVLRRQQRQRRGLQAALGVLLVLATLGGALTLRERDTDEQPPSTAPTSTTVVDDVSLVPATFDGRPRLDPVRDLRPCDDSTDLEQWATTVLDESYEDVPAAGTAPDGPMEPATVDDVARLAPVLVDQVTPTAAACLTSLRGPNDLLAWEQRDANGTLISRAVAAPWAGTAVPRAGTLVLPLQPTAESLANNPDDGYRYWNRQAGQLLVGGFISGEMAHIDLDGRTLLQIATANYGSRRIVEVYDFNLIPMRWDQDAREAATRHVAPRLVLAEWHDKWFGGPEPDELEPHYLPDGWSLCGGASPPDHDWGNNVTYLCGRLGERWFLDDEALDQLPTPSRHLERDGVEVGIIEDGPTIRLVGTHRRFGEPFARVLTVPTATSLDLALVVLLSIPVVGNPAVQLEVPQGASVTPTLAAVRAGLPSWIEVLDGVTDEDLIEFEAVLADDRDHALTMSAHRLASDGSTSEWWYQPMRLDDRGLLQTEPWPIVGDQDSDFAVVHTRCGGWGLSVHTARGDADEQIAINVLTAFRDAFGCG